ncbi:LOW QUALITY PROTEIN: polyprotein [Phytophthora megakarya]|uniref:Polyprotein n=1 Tax=Phytophthora megakarya TaxID=4795 RepID=A0A225W390_9STRA|nr:LOW QUALITY PROTEIN: polyprotein [Phytophthora megakarya]
MHSQHQQQTQMREMMAQQMSFQQQLLYQQTQSRLPQKKKGDPPTIQGNASEDLELWIFSTEQYYAQHREEMIRNTSEFVDTIFANLGTIAQTWFRDFKLSLGPEQPATWDLFKIRIRERFRDRDFQQKVLTKLHDLRWQGSQQEYTTKFLHLLSQLDEELPESVKRWMYQRNVRFETSSFISQNVPDTLQATIELAQRFEDSRPPQPGRKHDVKKETKLQNTAGSKWTGTQKQSEGKTTCEYCAKFGHTMDVCRARKRDAQGTGTGKSDPPKNGSARTIQDASVTTFVDSGASFNAIDPRVAERLNLKVVECSKPLELTLGMNNKVLVPRRIVQVDIQLTGFPVYTTEAFVMAIPEQKHFLLGMPWLEEVNPEIDWSNQIIKSRDTHGVTSFRQCIREGPATTIAGVRNVRRYRSIAPNISHNDLMMYYTKHTLASASGETRILASAKLSKFKLSDGEFCFFVRTASEKTARQLTTDWDAFQGHPVEPVILKYKDKVFVTELPSAPPQRSIDIEAEIELTDKTPVVRKQFRLSEEQKDAVRKWTREMLAAKVIRPSKSPFSSPTFCVKKAVGWRIVHDFRAINARVRVPATPIPRKEDIYDAMAKGKLFSALDLLWGFFQVRLREEDVPYTAFFTPDGLFEYLVTPMGLSCSPSAFNRLIQTIFSDQSDFCRAYFDDLFVFTNTASVDDHLAALDKGTTLVGIRMDPDKIRTIREWPTPRTKRELQSFLGTCVYVLKYCPEFALLTAPLTDATRGKSKNERIDLTPKQLEAFRELKQRLTSPPILAHPDSSLPFHVKTDASDYAVGGYLFQLDVDGHERIIAYGGRKLNTAERMYSTREKELLAALHAMRTWKPYLIDKPFYIDTDHRTLESLLQQTTCSQRLARWLNELSIFQPRFKWIPGDTNIIADAISRSPQLPADEQPSDVSLGSLLEQLTKMHSNTTPDESFLNYMRQRPSIQQQCQRLYPDDAIFGPLLRHLLVGGEQAAVPVDLHSTVRILLPNFFLDDGLIYLQSGSDERRRLCVPADIDLRNAILFECHDTAARGHPGTKKTIAIAQQKFYWLNMHKTIAKYVQSCELCQRVKASQQKPAGLLHPLEIPHKRWMHISMDFMPDLVVTKRGKFDSILVILDRLTKRAHFIPTRKTASAKDTAWIFLRDHVRLHGFPDSIVSDRDSRFLSAFWKELSSSQGSQLRANTAFKSSTDGQNERSHRFINDYLRAFVSPRQDNWDELLPMAEFAYNARPHDSIGMPPFEADLGYLPRSYDELAIPARSQPNRDALRFNEQLQVVLQRSRDSLAIAQGRMKHFYDQNRPELPLNVGDQVLLDTTHLDLSHIGADGRRKFAARFIGPYKILSSTTPDTYKISLPPATETKVIKSDELLVSAQDVVFGISKSNGTGATKLTPGSRRQICIKLLG